MSLSVRLSFPNHIIFRALFLLVLSVVAFAPRPASAGELVQLVSGRAEEPFVNEVLLRTRAELSAVGFQVLRCSHINSRQDCHVANAVASLEIVQVGDRLVLTAEAQGEAAPLVQELDLGERSASAELSAEVAAIRAVELLRAALLSAVREGRVELEAGGSVQSFTGVESTSSPRESEPAPFSATGAPATDDPGPDQSWRWLVGLGAGLEFPHSGSRPGVGGDLFFSVARPASVFLGAALDGVFVPTEIHQQGGVTSVTSVRAVMRVGWAASCGEDWVCHLGVGGGIQRFDFRAAPAQGYEGTDASHLTPYVGSDITFARYIGNAVGLYTRLRIGGVTDVPRLESAEGATLGAPSWGASVGIVFGPSRPGSP